MQSLLPEYKHLLALLVKHHVDFMIIGGYAVIYYGYPRTTIDLDVWLKPDNDNRSKLIEALKEFGVSTDSLNKLSGTDFNGTHCFYFGEYPIRTDFLTKISGVNYSDAAHKVNYFTIEKQKIPIIHFEHLILSKISTDRIQDKADVEMLQKIVAAKKKKNYDL